MRHSKTEKANTHKRIVTIAAKKFREEGLAGIGIADLMKKAGLTVGGFYKHFKSRDALVAEAIGSALEMWKDRIDAAGAGGPRITYESLVDDYLSEAHRNIQVWVVLSALWRGISHAATRALERSPRGKFETTSSCSPL